MRKIKGLRWYMIALVTLGTVLGYLTRNTVAAAAPTLMEELNISTQQYSYIWIRYPETDKCLLHHGRCLSPEHLWWFEQTSGF